jgi:hypothetical protein
MTMTTVTPGNGGHIAPEVVQAAQNWAAGYSIGGGEEFVCHEDIASDLRRALTEAERKWLSEHIVITGEAYVMEDMPVGEPDSEPEPPTTLRAYLEAAAGPLDDALTRLEAAWARLEAARQKRDAGEQS